MDGILEKISSYNIFNNLFPGAVFIYLLEKSFGFPFSGSDMVKTVILYYFVGMVISRIGSLLLEPMLKKVKIIKFRSYYDYIAASASDKKIELLQEIANTYRTLLTMSILYLSSIFIMQIITGKVFFISKIVSVSFLVIFLSSYIKQVNFVVKRIDKFTQNA